jgi:hypothetical protein
MDWTLCRPDRFIVFSVSLIRGREYVLIRLFRRSRLGCAALECRLRSCSESYTPCELSPLYSFTDLDTNSLSLQREKAQHFDVLGSSRISAQVRHCIVIVGKGYRTPTPGFVHQVVLKICSVLWRLL